MTFCLDVEMFISEVEKYPVIWDPNCEDNKQKTRKLRAWTHIARMLISDFDELPEHEKAEVDKKLQSKWRNIKDSYVRDLRKKDGKRYMYSKFLTFLDNRYKKEQSGSEADSKEWDDDETSKHKRLAGKRKRFDTLSESNWPSDSEEVPSTIDNLKRRRVSQSKEDDDKSKINFVDAPYPDASCSYVAGTVEDEDRSFFDSLLPAVREFNVDQKLEFRSEVLRLIKELRNNRICNNKVYNVAKV